jgi:hypothetical protein
MKDLTRSLLTFVLLYGTKDKTRFERHAYGLLDRYGLAEGDQKELVDYAYEFFHDLAQRFNQIDIISRGVNSGVSELEKKLEAIANKLSAIETKIATPPSEPKQ